MAFGLRLVQIQAVQASSYQNRANNEMSLTRTLPAQRGEITDIHGAPFARSVAAISIVVDQTLILDPAKVAAFVAPILGLTTAEVAQSITGTKRWSMVYKNAKPATWKNLAGQ